MWASDTSVLVMVVPMFAPIIIGIAPATEMAPPATMLTMMDVVVEELCTIAVARSPMNRPTKGEAVVLRICSEKPVPKSLTEWPIIPMPTMNR